MKNKGTFVSLLLATGSVVSLVIILGILENPSSSPSATNTIALPADQSKVDSPGILYEYDFDDDDDDDEKDKHSGKRKAKGKKYGKYSNSVPATSSTSEAVQNEQNPRQSDTRAS